jgi:hypothetical protein
MTRCHQHDLPIDQLNALALGKHTGGDHLLIFSIGEATAGDQRGHGSPPETVLGGVRDGPQDARLSGDLALQG